jgi:predicted CoA-substrate-specific enzyme activase
MRYFLGIDIGSLSTDGVVIDENRNVLAQVIVETGHDGVSASREALDILCKKLSIDFKEISFVVSTGYGRQRAPYSNEDVTEITCHARGAYHLFPKTKVVIDIGGQDSKVIKLNSNGRVVDFVMNDKCAAGTGRFLENMARALALDIETFGRIGLEAKESAQVSSMCTVFAESEIVSLIHQGVPRDKIIRGLHNSIAGRIAGMVERVGLEEEVTMSGGVAKNPGMVRAMEEKLRVKINIPEEPQTVGALGAALIAFEKYQQKLVSVA